MVFLKVNLWLGGRGEGGSTQAGPFPFVLEGKQGKECGRYVRKHSCELNKADPQSRVCVNMGWCVG